ncbi:hypothetical protein DFH27DRAFT_600079 [Peziza echinospora]|nr:hypothetical protein DFH27DRAFT_600079 [Peziza echinospora]
MNRNNLQYGIQDGQPNYGDMDAFLDLDIYPFAAGNGAAGNNNLSRTSSNQPSTQQPSFPYDLYQQTVPLPVHADFMQHELTSGASSSITMSPDLLDMDAQLNAMMPPFFFPESAHHQHEGNTVDPASILGAGSVPPAGLEVDYSKQAYIPQPAPQFDGKRLYAGIHTQRAAYNKDLENQRRMAQKKDEEASPTGSEMTLDDRINNVLSRMKPNGAIMSEASSPGGSLPHIARMKKDEEEMDEDERLLASEEGKKLSSKERRQLRNKVSARAFRSRRKEYITQLEAEVAAKAAEATELRTENMTLKSEIAQLKEFTRSVLRSPAFSSFLADLEKGQGAVAAAPQQQQHQQQQQARSSAPAVQAEPVTAFSKDPNPNMMNLANDDWALAYGPVAGAPMWATNTPQVYAVFDLPAGPVNLQELSGKAARTSMEDKFDWANFPPPADGFSPSFTNTAATSDTTSSSSISDLYTVSEEDEDVDMDNMDVIEFVAPENLADLYADKQGLQRESISERIEALAPGVGLDALLGRLEMVINGEAEASEFFEVREEELRVMEAERERGVQQSEEQSEELSGEERERCRSVARMFDVVETYKRIGAVVGV